MKALFWGSSCSNEKKPVTAEYVWIGGDGSRMYSKTRTLDVNEVRRLKDIPYWTCDGSNTNQATTDDCELVLKPVFYCKDPFRNEHTSILVLCTVWKWSVVEETPEKQESFLGREALEPLNGTTKVRDSDKEAPISLTYPLETMNGQCLEPAAGNFRTPSESVFNYLEDEDPLFEIEQEYLIVNLNHQYNVSQTD